MTHAAVLPDQDNRELLAALVERLDCAGMAEAFVRIAAADEVSLPNVAPDALAWLADTDLLAPLLPRRAAATFSPVRHCPPIYPFSPCSYFFFYPSHFVTNKCSPGASVQSKCGMRMSMWLHFVMRVSGSGQQILSRRPPQQLSMAPVVVSISVFDGVKHSIHAGCR
jgi:hypothetical protein